MKVMFSVFQQAIKFYAYFSLFFRSFYWQSSPTPKTNASKEALNHVWAHSSAKDSLRNTKNVIFCLFCIFVDRPIGAPQPVATLH